MFGNFGKMIGGMAKPAGQALSGAGRSVGQSFGNFGRGASGMAGPAASSFSQFQRPQSNPGGFMPRGGGGGSPFSGMMAARPMMGGGMAGGGISSATAGMLSDAESKEKIRTLEDELQRTYAALGGGPSTGNVQPEAPDTAALDAAYRKPSSNSYEYKDPSVPGAAPGRQAGPMADELKDLPGVVAPGADGMDRVDTGRLTMTNTSEIANLRRELDALTGRIGSGQSNSDGTY
jgi:hypothetical protein